MEPSCTDVVNPTVDLWYIPSGYDHECSIKWCYWLYWFTFCLGLLSYFIFHSGDAQWTYCLNVGTNLLSWGVSCTNGRCSHVVQVCVLDAHAHTHTHTHTHTDNIYATLCIYANQTNSTVTSFILMCYLSSRLWWLVPFDQQCLPCV